MSTARLRHLLTTFAAGRGRLAAVEEALEACVKSYAAAEDLKLGKIAQPLRAALCGSLVSPGIFEVMRVLGREECLGRIRDRLDPEA